MVQPKRWYLSYFLLGEKKGQRKVLQASTEEATLPNLQV